MGDPRKKENINGTFFGQGKGKVLWGPFSLPFERQDKHKVYKYNSYFSHRWLNKLWARNPYTQGRSSAFRWQVKKEFSWFKNEYLKRRIRISD